MNRQQPLERPAGRRFCSLGPPGHLASGVTAGWTSQDEPGSSSVTVSTVAASALQKTAHQEPTLSPTPRRPRSLRRQRGRRQPPTHKRVL
jgi:hypothetical protein